MKEITITKIQLEDMGAPYDLIARFTEQTDGVESPVEISSLVGGCNRVKDFIWFVENLLTKKGIVKFTCKYTLLSINVIRPYTDKYELIVEYLQNSLEKGYWCKVTGKEARQEALCVAARADKADAQGVWCLASNIYFDNFMTLYYVREELDELFKETFNTEYCLEEFSGVKET